MGKRLFALAAAILACGLSWSQLTSVVNEAIFTDDGSVTGYPVGATTYRIYANLQDSDDAITAVFAANNDDLLIGTSNGEMWNSPFGGIIGTDLNPAFFPVFPSAEYDSMVTVGRANSGDPGSAITAVSVIPSTTAVADAFGTAGPLEEWDANLELQDGTWFTTPDGVNAIGVGPDNSVLLAQITTLGTPVYNLNIQVLDGGIGGDAFLYVWNADAVDPENNEVDGSDLGLSFPSVATEGCTDATACNYDPDADVNDGSCIIVSAGEIITGPQETCSGDGEDDIITFQYDAFGSDGDAAAWVITDDLNEILEIIPTTPAGFVEQDINFEGAGAGNCLVWYVTWDSGLGITGAEIGLNAGDLEGCYDLSNPVEVNRSAAGCTDPAASNYDADACGEDGSCTYDAIPGCTDDTACNYDAEATEDDDSCLFATGCDECDGAGGVTDNPEPGDACDDGDANTINDTTQTDCSCAGTPVVTGCTDAAACNYNDAANTDDGSCFFPGDACDDGDANTTNDVYQSDCTCAGTAVATGCTDDAACNYDAGAVTDDGSCVYAEGCDVCDDNGGVIDNPEPGETCDDGDANTIDDTVQTDCSCTGTAVVNGCTDPEACNYDPTANADDGSCTYADPGFDCDGNCLEIPANDLCADAISIACGESLAGTTVCATDNDFAGSCSEDFSANGIGVWYTFTGTGGPILLSLCDEEYSFDTHIVLYDGGCGALNCLDGNDDYLNEVLDPEGDLGVDLPTDCSSTLQSALIYETVLGEPYHVYVTAFTFASPESGEFDFTLICSDVPELCVLESCPEDMTLECTADELDIDPEYTGMPEVSGDECNGEWDYADVSEGDDCLTEITRTWSYILPTGFELFTCEQVITIADMTPPVFLNDPVDQLVQCMEEVPEPEECLAEDECTSVVLTEIFTSETGLPVQTCELETAEGIGADWSIWLPVLPGEGLAPTAWWHFDGDGNLTKYDDGTAHLTGTVVNSENEDYGFIVDMWFENARDWEDWSALGRSYKDDFGLAAAGGDLWTTWQYFEMPTGWSTLTGTGLLSGTLQLFHMPADFYYGFQCGEAANNKNSGFGFSGWFTYEGFLNGNQVEGNADINVDAECVNLSLPDCPNDNEITYLWRAEDECGNVSYTDQIITVLDTTAPEFVNCPDDITVECDALDTLPDPADQTAALEATDNCENGEVTIEYLGEFPGDGSAGDCVYTLLRRWIATDACDNQVECIQTITVQDTTAPVWTFVPADVTYECDEEIILEDATATDNCAELDIQYSEEMTPGECPQEYTLTRTWTADDGCDHVITATQVITVQDTTAPVFDDYETELQIDCGEIVDFPPLTATDNCDEEVDIDLETVFGSGGCPGTWVYTWTATDDCGNSTTAVQYINITDTTPPVIDNPDDITVECDDLDSLPNPEDVTASDDCDEEPIITLEVEETPGPCDNNYTITWTWTAVDHCDNVSTATTTVTVQDTTDPEWDAESFPADETVECSDELPAIVFPTATDNCDDEVEVTVTEETEAGDCPQEYTLSRIFRAIDNCGNYALYVQTITVVDTTAPELEIAGDTTIECDEAVPAPAWEASDNCSEDLDEVVTEVIVDGNCPNNYTIERTYTVTDECDNSTSLTQIITVQDTTAPELEIAADVTIECDEEVPAPDWTASDNCSDVLDENVSEEIVEGNCPNNYTIERTYTVTDECDNTTSLTQYITVQDTTAPELEIAADVTIECDEEVPAPEWTASDNCSDELDENVSEEMVAGDCPNNYTIERTYTVSDECDNTTSLTQIITVQDTTAPELEIAADVTIECDEEVPGPEWTASDNCSDELEENVSEVIVDGDCPYNYTIERTYTVTDECDNSTSLTQIITVQDTTAPNLEIADDVTIECDEEVPAPAWEAWDNCSQILDEVVTEVIVDGNCPNNYTIERTYTVTDECDNATALTQYITVQDTTAPELEIAGDTTIECDEELPAPAWEASDNCSDDLDEVVTEVIVDGDCPNNYTVERTYTVTDECDNSTSLTQIITVQDTTAPELEIAADVTIECDEEVPAPEWTASDNCSDVLDENVSEEIIEGDCPSNYTIERTYTVTDECDNTTSLTQTITVQDTTPPVITGDPFTSMPCDMVDESITVEATDNCSEPELIVITYVDEFVSGGCPGNIIRDYTAIDECGNSSEFQQIISLYDMTAPEATDVPADVIIECDYDELPGGEPTWTDNCDEDPEVSFEQTEEGDDCTTVITQCWTAVDHCDNEATVCRTITITDTTAPNLEIADDVTIECDDEVPAAAWEAWDNCDEELDESVSEVIVDGDCPNNYTIERTYTVTDNCDNSTSLTQIITVQDTTAPELEIAGDTTIECDEELPAPAWEASDNCSDVLEESISEVIVDGNCPNYYTVERTYTVTDECDNSTSLVQIINVQDTTAPELEIAADVTIECDEEVPAPEWTASDNCSDILDENVSEEIIEGDCPNNYTIERTYTVTDECDNSTSLTQTITVQDTTPPVITGESFIDMPCDDISMLTLVEATDNCDDEVEITFEDEYVSGGCPGNIIRDYTATDDCGNSSTFQQIISLTDDVAPVASEVPGDETIECDYEELPGGEPQWDDNCDEDLTITFEQTEEGDDCTTVITQCWTAVDHCENATTVCRTITVTDTTAPNLEIADDATIECDEEIPAAAWEAWDNCDDELEESVTEVIVDGDCPNNYTIERTYTVTDNCDNSTSLTQIITVQDTTAPELEIAADVTIECDEEVPAPAWTASDNCSDDLDENVSEVIVDGDCPNNYTIERTYTVTDECDNSTSLTQIITVEDTTPPVFTFVPGDLDLECDDEVPAEMATAEDNCGDATVTMDETINEYDDESCGQFRTQTPGGWGAPGSGGNAGSYRDANFDAAFPGGLTIGCDNTLSLTSSQAVEDFLPAGGPSAELPEGDMVDPADYSNGLASHLVAISLSLGFDAYDADFSDADAALADLVINNGPYSGSTVGDVVALANEAIGGCMDDVNLSELTGALTMINENFIDGTNDNGNLDCEEEPDCGIYITRVYTATDACGNEATAVQNITILDTTAPELEIAADVTIECDEEVPAPEWTASDNCTEDLEESVTEEVINDNCPNNYTILRSYTVTDECDNSTTLVQVITVQDTTAPELEIAADVTIECDEDVPGPEWTASDNCSDELEESVTEVTVDGDCPNNYTIERTYTVTDECDNSTSLTQIITVQDTTAPNLEIADDVTIECDEEVPAPAWEAWDNCSDVLNENVTEVIVDGSCPNNYTIERTYTVTDECDNTTSLMQTITVQDTTDPFFTFVPQGDEYSCDEEIPVFEATADDNCGAAVVTSSEETTPGNCPESYSVTITWTATDLCDNTATATTTYYVYDDEAPSIDTIPEDQTYACADEVPDFSDWTATDNCDPDVDVSTSEEILSSDECGNYVALITCTATDNCGNASSVSFTVTVEDNIDPVLFNVPEDVVVDCEDEVPAAPEVTATDNCDDDLEVIFTEETFGDAPDPDALDDCTLISPESPFYDPDWALWLQDFPGGYDYYTLVQGDYVSYPDGSAIITGSVVSVDNANAGWDFVVNLDNGLAWPEWSTQDFPTSFKDDFGVAGDNYLDWLYYIIQDSSTLTGWGDFAGNTLTLSHAPSSYFYGYQVGIAANNVNTEYGSGGWIYYEGVFEDEEVDGAGDFAFDHDCCPDYSIVRTWCVTDCSENTVCQSQTITFGDIPDVVPNAPGVDVTDTESDFDIMAIAPNPTIDQTSVKFGAKRDMQLTLEVYDLSGRRVNTLFDGSVEANVLYNINFEVSGLKSGLYSVRLYSNTDQVNEKLVITK